MSLTDEQDDQAMKKHFGIIEFPESLVPKWIGIGTGPSAVPKMMA